MARKQPVVARNFLGIGSMGDTSKREDVVGKPNLSHGADHSMSINACPTLNHMAIAGMKHSTWSKAATMQRFLPPRGSFEERFIEQSAENLQERSLPHPSQMQDLVSNNHKNGLRTQAWWQGDSIANGSAQLREECGPTAPISGGFWGLTTRTMISPSKPEAVVLSGVPASLETRVPSSATTDVQHNASLTIFYAGNVNVYNNISAEKAQEIMLLASGGNMQGSPVEPLTATVAVKSMTGTATLSAHKKSPINLHSSQTLVSQQAKANQVTTNMKLDFTHLNIPMPSCPAVPTGQPEVPTALPHARKASLTRFFERRKERVHSKCPYYAEREDSSLPEERLSSSNDPTSYAPGGEHRNRKKVLIPAWMQSAAECSTSDIAVEEEQKSTAT